MGKPAANILGSDAGASIQSKWEAAVDNSVAPSSLLPGEVAYVTSAELQTNWGLATLTASWVGGGGVRFKISLLIDFPVL